MHAFVINLVRSPDRRAHIEAELAKTRLRYRVVTAVDGYDIDLHDRALVHPALLAKNSFPAGTAGCALSHLRAYEQILADGHDSALVLEDDVRLPADLASIAQEVVAHLTGAEVALLNYGSPAGCRMSARGSVELGSSRLLALPLDATRLVNAAAYVITREACERMVERRLPLRANADDWQFFYDEGILDRIRCVLPLPVEKTAEFESTIGLYSLGNGFRGRLVRPIVRHPIPILNSAILRRRRRIMRAWERSEIVDAPSEQTPSRLG